MKRFFSFIGGAGGIVLTVYLWIVFAAAAFLALSEKSDNTLTAGCVLALIPAALVSAVLMRLLQRFEIKTGAKLTKRSHRLIWYFGFALAGLGILLLYYKGFAPGCFTEDSINQLRQAMSGQYNNWHPVLQTLFAFTLPLALTGGWMESIVLFQVICFAFSAAYLCCAVLEYGNRIFALVSFAFIYCNPVTGLLSTVPWKDTSFAIAAMLCMSFAVRTFLTNGEWMKNPWHIGFSIAAFSACSIFRHNGFFFTLPLLAAVVICASKKAKIALGVGVLALCVLITVPLYTVMDVEAPGSRATESLGLPIAVIGEVAAREPGKMDEEMKEFAYSVASPNMWENNYLTGIFNSIKFSPDTHTDVIEEYGVLRVLGMMFKAFRLAPKSAVRSMIALTDMVYSLTGTLDWQIYPYIARNDYGLTYSGDSVLNRELLEYSDLTRTEVFRPFFWMLGFLNLAVAAGLCAALKRSRGKRMWCKLLIAGSMLIYNFGTMLLLSGFDFRFFYYSYTVIPLILLVLFRKDETDAVLSFSEAGMPENSGVLEEPVPITAETV